jgi:WD40 repeat protein
MNASGAGEIFDELERVELSSNAKNLVRTSQGDIWCGCKDGTIHVLDYESGRVLQKIEGPVYAGSRTPVKVDVTSITLIDQYVWTGSTEGLIRMWDSTNCQ